MQVDFNGFGFVHDNFNTAIDFSKNGYFQKKYKVNIYSQTQAALNYRILYTFLPNWYI